MATESDDGALQVKLIGAPFHRLEATEGQSFIKFLHSWGGAWLWKRLVMTVDTRWLTKVVTNNTLICITDGSYNLKKPPTSAPLAG